MMFYVNGRGEKHNDQHKQNILCGATFVTMLNPQNNIFHVASASWFGDSKESWHASQQKRGLQGPLVCNEAAKRRRRRGK